ncbi:hypothetical protein GM418_25755 [Maribellus comscasis]|uniref:Transposase IS66 zinc-finger binding domain-containing protein n=1 Tax=Maribellus comscasis TaxID=2681766 RepID=A0A6I6JWD9_9BACT|nr:IS66 family transposase zinc-finger binding domain-containing protein [Maribellus comscasis]QGY46941.1 hypothetical protein GM418_25755 [Maribellus comscasis]
MSGKGNVTKTITYTREKKGRKNHPGRIPLPDHLPVEEIVLEPEEDTTGMKCIGREVTDQLELVPAKFFIKRFIRPKYIRNINTYRRHCPTARLPY